MKSPGLAATAPDVLVGIEQSWLFNADLGPVSADKRKWGMLSFAASVPAILSQLYNYAWFVGFAAAFVAYLALRAIAPGK